MLQDCEGIQSKVKATDLNNESLIKLAKYYHNQTCDDPDEPCIIYEKGNRRIFFSIIPVINFSHLKVTSSNMEGIALRHDFINQKKISYGLKLKFSNFQYINYHLSTQIGVFIQEQYFVSDDDMTSVEFKVLEIPLDLSYSFKLNSKLNPFLGVSVNPYFRLKKDIVSYYYVSEVSTNIKTFNTDFSGIVGLDYYFYKNLFFTTNIQYKIGGAFYNSSNIDDNSKSKSFIFQIGLGYVIK